MKMKIRVSHMCAFLQERFYETVEPKSQPDISSRRIRELALSKLRQQSANVGGNTQNKEKHMKTSIKVLLIAAIVFAMSVTAFASFGGLEYFKAIFGDSAGAVEDYIQFPAASTENESYRLTVESLLSDGFKTDLIVSLTAKDGKAPGHDPKDMFSTRFTGGDASLSSSSYQELYDFSVKSKKYYHLELTSLSNSASAEVTVALKEELAPLSVTIPTDGTLTARKQIQVKTEDYAEQNYYPETVQLSPMGVLVIGSEKEAKGGLPTAQIFVKMKDGKSEELISEASFDDSEETVSGGGGVVLGAEGETAPLVTGTMGERNPDGKVVTTGTFSRILNLDEVQAIIVDGVEYSLK